MEWPRSARWTGVTLHKRPSHCSKGDSGWAFDARVIIGPSVGPFVLDQCPSVFPLQGSDDMELASAGHGTGFTRGFNARALADGLHINPKQR